MTKTIILRRGRDDAGQACRFLQSLPHDKPWRVEVSEYRPRRSEQQNRYLFGVCYREILKHFEGWRIEDVHDYMLGEHFGWEQVETMRGTVQLPIRRSSRLNKQEFSDFIAFIQQRAAEHGIVIPDPDVEPQ